MNENETTHDFTANEALTQGAISANRTFPSLQLWEECSLISSTTKTIIYIQQNDIHRLFSLVELSKVYIVKKRESSDFLCVNHEDFNTHTHSTGDKSKRTPCGEFVPNAVDEYGVTFWLLLTLTFIWSFAVIGIYPVLETTVLGVLGKRNRHKFGNQRLWASVGSGVASLIIGCLSGKSI